MTAFDLAAFRFSSAEQCWSFYNIINIYINNDNSSSDAVLLENQNLDLLFDQMLRSRYDSAGGANSDEIVADTNDYYNKFHSANTDGDPVVELERERESGSAVIGGLTVKAWNGKFDCRLVSVFLVNVATAYNIVMCCRSPNCCVD